MDTDAVPDDVLLRLNTFGELLKYLRRRARLTQDELAAQVGYSRTHIAKLEANERQPDAATVAARFIPVLDVDDQPKARAKLLALANGSPMKTSGVFETPEVSRPRHTPPLALNSFIGREREVSEIRSLVAQAHLLTLVGSGGAGKTRLALEAARKLIEGSERSERSDPFADGIRLVELAPLNDPVLVPNAVAEALGVYQSSQDVLALLIDALRPKHALLILDNCEHLITACAQLAEALLQSCPNLRILATSREPLLLPSETVFRVPSLSLPAPDEADVEAVAHSEATQLFVSRVRMFKPDFAADARTAPLIAQICTRLDGIPLAIELAATRMRAMTLGQLAQRLRDRFDVLTAGSRAALPRQQTLFATIDWSYQLLNASEQRALRLLSVFAGGWSLEAAETVIGSDALDPLAHLVSKSLVLLDDSADEPRYSMLETIRQFARHKLIEVGEAQQAEAVHARTFAAFVDDNGWVAFLENRKQTFDRYERDHDNLRAALRWAAACGDADTGTRILAGMSYFWFRRGYWQECLQWSRMLLPLAKAQNLRTVAHARAITGIFGIASRLGEYAYLAELLDYGSRLAFDVEDEQAIALASIAHGYSTGDPVEWNAHFARGADITQRGGLKVATANILFLWGDRLRADGDLNGAAQKYRDSIGLLEQVGERDLVAYPIGNLGRLAFDRGDYAEAQAAIEQSIAISREIGSKLGVSEWTLQLARACLRRGDLESACDALAECLIVSREVGSGDIVNDALVVAAGVALGRGRADAASKLLGYVQHIRGDEHTPHILIEPGIYRDMDEAVKGAKALLTPGDFAAAWKTGERMSRDEAIELAMSG